MTLSAVREKTAHQFHASTAAAVGKLCTPSPSPCETVKPTDAGRQTLQHHSPSL